MSRETLISAILAERRAQVERWGNAHDDAHTASEWVALIGRHLGQATGDGSPNDSSPGTFRHAMIRVSAIALAAAEAIDRRPPVTDADRLYALAQGVADSFGEPALILPAGRTRTDSTGCVCVERMPCAVLLSRATPEEIKQAVARVEPRRMLP